MKKLKNKKGFTLVELVVVMVILGILAVILIPKMSGVQDGARTSACRANLRTLDSMTAVWLSEDVSRTADKVTVADLVAAKLITAGQAVCPGTDTNAGTYTKPADADAKWTCDKHTPTPTPTPPAP